MLLVRKSKVASEPNAEVRIVQFRAELEHQLREGGVSVFRVEPGDQELVAALYCAPGDHPHGFPFFTISDDLFTSYGVGCVQILDESSPFKYLRERHYEIREVSNLDGFVACVAAEEGQVFTKGAVRRRIHLERQELAVTTTDEWSLAKPWTLPP